MSVEKMSEGSSGSDAGNPVHHVSIKPPPFMETAVAGWFAVIDAQFHIANVKTESTKFYHVLSALPPDTIAHLPKSVLTSASFTTLQEAVTDMYEKTKPELFERLIRKSKLAGRPSLFLAELREMGDKVGVGDELIRHKFIQSLPSAIAAALASQRELGLSALGKLADELVPLVQGASVNVCDGEPQCFPGVNPQQPPPQYAPCNLAQYPRWRPQQSGQMRYPTRAQGTADFSGVPLSLRPYHDGQRPQVCRAHLYFGARARTCKPWCRWPTKAAGLTMQPSSRAASPARVSNPDQTPAQGN